MNGLMDKGAKQFGRKNSILPDGAHTDGPPMDAISLGYHFATLVTTDGKKAHAVFMDHIRPPPPPPVLTPAIMGRFERGADKYFPSRIIPDHASVAAIFETVDPVDKDCFADYFVRLLPARQVCATDIVKVSSVIGRIFSVMKERKKAFSQLELTDYLRQLPCQRAGEMFLHFYRYYFVDMLWVTPEIRAQVSASGARVRSGEGTGVAGSPSGGQIVSDAGNPPSMVENAPSGSLECSSNLNQNQIQTLDASRLPPPGSVATPVETQTATAGRVTAPTIRNIPVQSAPILHQGYENHGLTSLLPVDENSIRLQTVITNTPRPQLRARGPGQGAPRGSTNRRRTALSHTQSDQGDAPLPRQKRAHTEASADISKRRKADDQKPAAQTRVATDLVKAGTEIPPFLEPSAGNKHLDFFDATRANINPAVYSALTAEPLTEERVLRHILKIRELIQTAESVTKAPLAEFEALDRFHAAYPAAAGELPSSYVLQNGIWVWAQVSWAQWKRDFDNAPTWPFLEFGASVPAGAQQSQATDTTAAPEVIEVLDPDDADWLAEFIWSDRDHVVTTSPDDHAAGEDPPAPLAGDTIFYPPIYLHSANADAPDTSNSGSGAREQ
ncbi:hypothetical protein FN846DRAFT_918970 [Sphaerosporella brunnea]|uniref:Uncharacterized protein n=1 Tax=Sphaerosporella brunnea TaxID=1250544 RepID=A0A5J5EXG5_9PEZI|nr:hypothetical protein FN846DRAFT_918970 [Sphaerosporella brunnea]